MDLKELIDLIAIRGYVVNSVNNALIDRKTVTELNNSLLLLDKKIIAIIKSPDFKNYINYQDINQITKEIVDLNNIKSGLTK